MIFVRAALLAVILCGQSLSATLSSTTQYLPEVVVDETWTYQLTVPRDDVVAYLTGSDGVGVSRKLLKRRNRKPARNRKQNKQKKQAKKAGGGTGGGNSLSALAASRNKSCLFTHCGCCQREVLYSESPRGKSGVLDRAMKAWLNSPSHRAIITKCPKKGCHVAYTPGRTIARCLCA